DHGLEELGFVPLTGRDVNPQEDAVILADQVDLGAEAALGVAQRMVRRLLQLRRLGPGQDAGSARIFFRPGGGVTGPDDRGVDAPEVVAQAAPALQVIEQPGHEAGPGPVLPPAVEPIIDGLPRAIPLREVPPGGPGVEHPEDAIEDRVMVVPGAPRPAVMGGMGQEGFDLLPKPRVELIAASHGGHPFGIPPPPSYQKNKYSDTA